MHIRSTALLLGSFSLATVSICLEVTYDVSLRVFQKTLDTQTPINPKP